MLLGREVEQKEREKWKQRVKEPVSRKTHTVKCRDRQTRGASWFPKGDWNNPRRPKVTVMANTHTASERCPHLGILQNFL